MLSLEQWLDYQAQVHPQAIDLGLDRLQRVLERLRWRQPRSPIITIAGTNGKGSVSAYCSAILMAAGYRVGTFTSPHLRDYRERIRIHDRLVSADELISAFERIEAARGEIGLTFFEFNALAAFLLFEAADLDAWVLEIGMGGRLDAVNAVEPDVAVVVSIGLDHQEYLGTSLEAIAREKAGIFRKGKPAILGSHAMPSVIEDIAADVGAWVKRLGAEFTYSRDGDRWRYQGSCWELSRLPPPALAGECQFANAATALAALEELRLSIPEAAVARGLAAVRLPGRFQTIPRTTPGPTWILDVAHNPAAASVMADNLGRSASSGRPFHGYARTLAVCGMLSDKDAAGIAAVLRGCIDVWWCTSTEGARGQSGIALAEQVRSHVNVPVHVAASVAEACTAASSAAADDDRIIVFGSFHTVGPALDWLESRNLLPSAALPEYTAAPRAT